MNDTSEASRFLAGVEKIGFFARLFSWKKIKKAARRASEDLAGRENQYRMELNTCRADITRLEESARAESANLSRITLEKQTLESRLAAGEMREREKDARISALYTEKSDAESSLAIEKAARKTGEENVRDLSGKYEKLQTDYENTKTAAIEYKNKAEAAGKTESDLQTLKTEHTDLENRYNSAKQELAEVRGKLESEQNTAAGLKQQIETLASENRTKQDKVILLESRLDAANTAARDLENKYAAAESDLRKTHDELTTVKASRESEMNNYSALKTEYTAKLTELTEAKKKIAADERVKEEQTREYEKNVTALNTLMEEQRTAKRELEQKELDRIEEHNRMLEKSWKRHESEVEDYMREIANRYDFALCEKSAYPYRGTPDNAFIIGGMFTIFDAKSPKNPEDLDNFPAYLKQQAEGMDKYCKNEKVRKDAFLVVPSSTLSVLDTFKYSLADYTVYVISPEAVLPVLEILKVIESYDFADQLSPEDHAEICQLIGRMSHTAKRKIQIDNYMSREMISVLQGISRLPDDFEKEIGRYEKEAKMNPPMEKRAKLITIKSIDSEVEKIYNDTLGWSVSPEENKA
ncbi:MAG TPA: hypothetical protein O0X39_07310 [Methanocorpusculum sp.]|nr:hypothetical protein [Methanocorpusculum sp.]